MRREIVLDTETTGLDPANGHRIVEIGCVELLGGVRSGRFFHSYLDPERDMPQEAFRIHGLSGEFLSGKPTFARVADEFLAFLADAPLIIHNAAFDLKFLNSELDRLGYSALPFERVTDTVMVARKKFPGAPASLDALCRRFEIDLSTRTKHGALLDAELLADVYLELCGGRQVTLALDAETATADRQTSGRTRAALPPRSFPPSPEELAAHTEMRKKLKNAVWDANREKAS